MALENEKPRHMALEIRFRTAGSNLLGALPLHGGVGGFSPLFGEMIQFD